MRPQLIPYNVVEDALFEVQKLVQGNITPAEDIEAFGVREHWATVYGKGMGDCDDYAITKLRHLIQRFPTHGRSFRLATCCRAIKDREIIDYHMVLLAHTTRGVYVLDNLYPKPEAIIDIRDRVWCYQEPAEAGEPWVHFNKPPGRDTIRVLLPGPDRKVA